MPKTKLGSRKWLPILPLYFLNLKLVNAQCSGTTTFEKLTNVETVESSTEVLYSSSGSSITAECNNRCRQSDTCEAFLLDYAQNTCFVANYSPNSISDYDISESEEALNLRSQLKESDSSVNLYVKTCLNVKPCTKAWIFERVLFHELDGFDDMVIEDVPSHIECEEACLAEQSFICRSAEYDFTEKICRLSQETRRTRAGAFRESRGDVDYLENQCAPSADACDFVQYYNKTFSYTDLQVTLPTQIECEERCRFMTAFNCRSFVFIPGEQSCRLSGDDSISAGYEGLVDQEGHQFYEKLQCVDLRLQCTGTDMTVTLNTETPFNGKIFSVLNPRGCNVKGEGDVNASLTFTLKREDDEVTLSSQPRALVTDSGCEAVPAEDGVYTNTIIIQQHPVIQQKGDRAITLYCFFETASEKVLSNGYNVIAQTFAPEPIDPRFVPGIPNSVVNSTAPQPNVILRIVNEDGEDIEGTQLGEALFIRIELTEDSIFDIFARNLVAQSGLDDEEIKLLDDRGCPTDPVFPGFAKDSDTGALVGKFQAFKFSDTTEVNFQVNVQFCQDACEPTECPNGVTSFGRRRKRRSAQGNEIEAIPSIFEGTTIDSLNKLTTLTPLTKRITVRPAERISDIEPTNTAGSEIYKLLGDGLKPEDVVCLTWSSAIITGASFVFLQFCILVVCVLCVCASRNRSDRENEERKYVERPPPSQISNQQSSISGPGIKFRMNESADSASLGDPLKSSGNTMRSLRTSFRD